MCYKQCLELPRYTSFQACDLKKMQVIKGLFWNTICLLTIRQKLPSITNVLTSMLGKGLYAFNQPCLYINLSYNLILSKGANLGLFKHQPNKLKLNAELHLLEILSHIFNINLVINARGTPLKSLKEGEFPHQPEGWKI